MHAIIVIVIFCAKWMHGGLNLCVFLKIYESELWATQLDGSLSVTPKHVLTGVKHSMIGHQTSQVKQTITQTFMLKVQQKDWTVKTSSEN